MVASARALRPSAAGIWGKPDGCTAYVQMAAQFPETEESEAAREGTAAHEIGALMINAAAVARKPEIPTIASNGVVITDDMIDAAQIYDDDVGAVMRSSGVFGGPDFNVEQFIDIPYVHDQNGGTPDAWIFDRTNSLLYIWDFKFGFGFVDVFENWQMLDYLSGIITRLELDGIADQHITVVFRIVQPRAFHHEGSIREWRVKASDLRAYFNILHANAHKVMSGEGECRTGSHCKNCNARFACTAAQYAGYNAIEHVGKPLPVELTPLQLSTELAIMKRAQDALKFRVTGLESQAEALARKGAPVPGWKMVNKMGRVNWTHPVEDVIAVGEMMGVDVSKATALTPKQAETAGLDPGIIAAYSGQKINGVKLIEDNPRRVFTK